MVTISEGLQELEAWRVEQPELKATGLAALDAATGGFKPGQCWVVVGTPGQGRSALAAQWAWLLAREHGFTTQHISKREPATRVAARIASTVAKVPLEHLWLRGMSEPDLEKLLLVRTQLDAAPLSILEPGDLSIADADMVELSQFQVLVVDDAHHAGGMFPNRVATLVANGHLLVLTLPRDRVTSGEGMDPEWAAAADFVLDLERPDMCDRTTPRPGEADLHLLRNRWGPTQSFVAGFQGHYARFVDITTS